MSGENNYDRFNPFVAKEKFSGYEIQVGPKWEGKSTSYGLKVSEDGGKTFLFKDRIPIFAAYFFISEDIKSYEKHLYTFIDLLADFGGLYQTIVLGFFVFIGSTINKSINTIKVIKATQFLYDNDDPTIRNIKPIKFSTLEKLKIVFHQIIPFKEDKDFKEIFDSGEEIIHKQFNMLTIVDTINKIKATL